MPFIPGKKELKYLQLTLMTTHHVLAYLRHNRLLSETLLKVLQILIQPHVNKGNQGTEHGVMPHSTFLNWGRRIQEH